MQVSHDTSSETVAVLGGQRKRDFKAKVAGHAFKIMSDSLYAHKELAVVREVISNALDAHIRAGKTDVPIEITVTADDFTVKDSGAGIADDKIDDIYCTLFGSDKTDDDTQIGGFGLGAKAPFAVTDHFTVTSRHAGRRTIYTMHLDGNEDGLPVCQEMTGGPCGDDTGLTVTIPISGKSALYAELTQAFVRDGNIKATLNGELLETNDYSELREVGYGVVRDRNSTGKTIKVLLGNVLYPLESKSEFMSAFVTATRKFSMGFVLILHAEPGTVAPTPAREGLSYTTQTIETVKGLLAKVNRYSEDKALDHFFLKPALAKAAREAGRWDLMETMKSHLTGACELFITEELDKGRVVAGPRGLALARLKNARDNVSTYTLLRHAARVLRDKGHVLRQLASNKSLEPLAWHGDLCTTNYRNQTRRETIKAATRLVGAENLDKLYIDLRSDYSAKRLNPIKNGMSFVRCTFGGDERQETSGFALQRTLVVARRKSHLDEQEWHKADFVLIDPKITDAQIEALKVRAKTFGFNFYFDEKIEAAKPAPKKKKPKPIKDEDYKFTRFALDRSDELFWTGGDRAFHLAELEPTVEKPEGFIMIEPYRPKGTTRLDDKNQAHAWVGLKTSYRYANDQLDQQIAELFPNVVVALNERERDLLIARKVPNVVETILAELEKAKNKHQDFIHYANAAAQSHYRKCASYRLSADRRLASLMANEPYKKDAALDRIWKLVFIANRLDEGGWVTPHYGAPAYLDFEKRWRTLADFNRGGSTSFTRRDQLNSYAYGNRATSSPLARLQEICAEAHTSSPGTERYEEVIALLEFIQKRDMKRSKLNGNS